MRSSTIALGCLLASGLGLSAAAQNPHAAPATTATGSDALKAQQDQVSYAIGLNIGAGLRRDSIAVDPEALTQGVQDALVGGDKPQMTQEQMRAVLIQLQATVQARRQEKAAHAAADNQAEGAAFLKANGAKPGVVTLPSGLEYQILTAGTGPKPKLDDTVICNYRGTLLDGTEFDSSYKRGAADTFPVSGVIKGWTEALQRMPVGSKWRIFVPAALAYGEKGAEPDIGPNAVLIFDIELLSIQAKG